MRLPAFLRPLKDQTIRTVQRLARAAVRPPTLEEFESPLRERLKESLAVKGDIGYAEMCACCRAHHIQDAHIQTAVAELEDPQPWLESLHGELVTTQEELRDTRKQLADERTEANKWKNPIRRVQWIAAGGTTGIVLLVIKELFQMYVLPLILP